MDSIYPSSESLSLPSPSRSVGSIDVDLAEDYHPPPDEDRNTPFHDTQNNSLGTLTNEISEKGIVVDAPKMEIANSSAIMVGDDIDDYEEDDDEEDVVHPFSKRKRTSTNHHMDDDMTYTKARRSSTGERPVKRSRAPRQPKLPKQQRGVIIGVWRESDQPDDEDKHVINAFIDNQDRLRTRIYGANRRGEELVGNIPTGAGSCWVTFPKVIFDVHLKPLSAAEIKEYVRIRSDDQPEATPEKRHAADLDAVTQAQAIVAAQEDQSAASKPIVHRPSLGRAQSSHRSSLPNQSPNHTSGFKAINATNGQAPKPSPLKDGRINGVLIGYWIDSDEPRVQDKHAVYGVPGAGDSFRVKVQKVTRDGRYVNGNFPVGAGAMWIHYDKVVFEPQLQGLSRHEIKEYCRIRQRDLENGELAKDREINEANALREAKEISVEGGISAVVPLDVEVRQSARSEQRMTAKQQSEAEAQAEKIRQEKLEARERQNERTRKEVAMAEADLRARETTAQAELKHNLKKLNKVWVAQQAATVPDAIPKATPAAYQGLVTGSVPAVGAEVKFHNGIRYERKQNGPFQGKLVSSAQLLSIDGEDYVEYRVLTQPSF